jgi:hypothetical protein
MKTEEMKTAVKSLDDLNRNYAEVIQAMKGTGEQAQATKKLWRKGNNPILIKVGLALIAFPDPTISDVVGAFLVAAGSVQQGIRRRTLYVEDVYKTFQGTLKEVAITKESV